MITRSQNHLIKNCWSVHWEDWGVSKTKKWLKKPLFVMEVDTVSTELEDTDEFMDDIIDVKENSLGMKLEELFGKERVKEVKELFGKGRVKEAEEFFKKEIKNEEEIKQLKNYFEDENYQPIPKVLKIHEEQEQDKRYIQEQKKYYIQEQKKQDKRYIQEQKKNYIQEQKKTFLEICRLNPPYQSTLSMNFDKDI